MKTDNNVETLVTVLRIHRTLYCRIIAEDLNMDKETAKQILTSMNMKKLCEKMVLKLE